MLYLRDTYLSDIKVQTFIYKQKELGILYVPLPLRSSVSDHSAAQPRFAEGVPAVTWHVTLCSCAWPFGPGYSEQPVFIAGWCKNLWGLLRGARGWILLSQSVGPVLTHADINLVFNPYVQAGHHIQARNYICAQITFDLKLLL